LNSIKNLFEKTKGGGEKMIIPDWAVGLIFSLRARCKPTGKVTMVNNIFISAGKETPSFRAEINRYFF